jgi:hypothetical protein
MTHSNGFHIWEHDRRARTSRATVCGAIVRFVLLMRDSHHNRHASCSIERTCDLLEHRFSLSFQPQ